MSQLTEEQRRKIEENRLKALEKRAKANGSAPSTSAQKANFPSKPYPANTNLSSKSIAKIPDLQTSTSFSNTAKANKFLSSKSEGNKSASKTFSSEHAKNGEFNMSKDYVKGTCVLLDRKRFYVDVPYHKELIELFKTVPSRLYDMQSKKWNFPIEDHDKVLSVTKPLQPDVMLIPLPPLINTLFKNVPENRKIAQQNLSALDPVLLASLLPFQKEGVEFAIQHEGRVLIADDMGLGKTIQAIAISNYYSDDYPLLVVTPSSVRYAWKEAFHRWLPSLDEEEISVINSGKDHIPNNKVVLISYDLLSKMKKAVQNRNFKSVIFDESHFLKNYKSARTRAAEDISKGMRRVLMLSGTPALSRPIELYTQLSILRPKRFFDAVEYGLRYCKGKRGNWGWDFNGSSNMEELQIFLEEEVMIRRLKSAVIQQLPEKFRQMIVLDPSQVQNKSKVMMSISKRMRQQDLKSMERRGILLEYFHETGQVKLKAVCEYIRDLLQSDKKFICFAHHQIVMNGICDAIDAEKKHYIRIDGSVSSVQRKKLCDEFQLNDRCQVAVLSITSANCGITLTAASLVVFAELFWNPGILTQAEDRAHRIGQENSVVVQYLVAKGTADDEIWPLVQRKLDILNKAGLSKDNFKSADTVMCEDKRQTHLDDFWSELDESPEDLPVDLEVPEKRIRLK